MSSNVFQFVSGIIQIANNPGLPVYFPVNTLQPLPVNKFPVRVLVENTAGGENACARTLDRIALLWDAIGEYDVGLCLDTCHAWAAGEDLETLVERVRAITGRVDLVHANSSRDPHDSARDRHAGFATGTIPPELIAHVVREAGCDAIVETPAETQADDIAFLKAALAG